MRLHLTSTIGRLGAACLAATLVCAVAATSSLASRTQESILQDDPQVLGASVAQLDARMALLKAIGVDRLRVSVFWGNVAPQSKSQERPSFPAPGPSHPKSYPSNSWRPYDNIAQAAARHGLPLLFTLTGPAPAWATPGRHDREGLFRPSSADFRDFATAVGVRYSGTYPVDDRFPTSDGPLKLGPIELGPPAEAAAPALPRVSAWSVWNEPNFPSWLLPVWIDNKPLRARDMVAAAPHHYRRLVDAAWAGLHESGHGRDLILIGETSPRGAKEPTQLGNAMAPAEFTRELYCVRANLRPYVGEDAARRGCPRNAAARRDFRRLHPALFKASGFAHHPYSLDRRGWRTPPWRHPLRDNVPIGNLGRLTRTLDGAARSWGARTRMPIWITEYGYQTRPPDPLVGVRLERQGPLTAWGEQMAYRNPRVASIAQFLFVDDGPVPGFRGKDRRRWITWQSGLYFANRRPKPALGDYLRPIHAVQRGRAVRLFGGYRAAATGVPVRARIEYAVGGGRWETLRDITVRNRRGYLSEDVSVPQSGLLRIVWRDPTTRARQPSRPVSVR